MLASNGPHWFDRRQPDSRWPSIGISLGLTVAMFAAALTSMRSVGFWPSAARREEPPVVVRLDAPPPPPKPTPTTRPAPTTVAAPTEVPTTIAPPNNAPVSVTPAPQPVPPQPHVDTIAAIRAKQREIPAGAVVLPHNFGLPDTAMAIPGGAPNAQTGVTIGSRTANTAKFRDSVITARLAPLWDLRALPVPAGAVRAELDQSKRNTDQLMRRATTAGNSRDVHISQGEGLGGAGAIGGNPRSAATTRRERHRRAVVQLRPSAAQRRKNEARVRQWFYLRGLQTSCC